MSEPRWEIVVRRIGNESILEVPVFLDVGTFEKLIGGNETAKALLWKIFREAVAKLGKVLHDEAANEGRESPGPGSGSGRRALEGEDRSAQIGHEGEEDEDEA